MKLFLIGYMGSGKSSLGKGLAAQLGIPFFDLDELIEMKAGYSIAEIFEKEGEGHFRKLESTTLKSLAEASKCIIATGGGTPCFFDNIDWMNENGMTLYLKCSPTRIVQRLKNGLTHRPILKDKSEKELLLFIEQHLIDRSPNYERAQIVYLADADLPIALHDLSEFLERFYG